MKLGDIHPPSKVVESMHQQVSAERTKRAQILESEGNNLKCRLYWGFAAEINLLV